MKNFAVSRQGNRACFVHRLSDFLAADFARTCAKRNAALAVDPTDMWPGNSKQRMLHWNSSCILCLLDRALNRANSLFQIENYTFARAERLSDAMPAIAQTVARDLSYKYARFGTAYIDRGQIICVLISHIYCSWFLIDGLGFLLDELAAAGLAGVAGNLVCDAAGTTCGFGVVCAFTTVFFLGAHFFVATAFAGDFDTNAFAVFIGPIVFAGGFVGAGGPYALECVTNAACFTPAADAVLTADIVRGAGFSIPRKSGFTTICRSQRSSTDSNWSNFSRHSCKCET